MSSFNEFLKKESFNNIPLEFFKVKISKGVVLNQKAVSVRSLGEYRLKCFLENVQTKLDLMQYKTRNWDASILECLDAWIIPEDKRKQDLQEAIACLGEVEVRKRLEELK